MPGDLDGSLKPWSDGNARRKETPDAADGGTPVSSNLAPVTSAPLRIRENAAEMTIPLSADAAFRLA
jgi:hypothetical protein